MININKCHMFLSIFIAGLFSVNTAFAQVNPYEINIMPPNMIVYEPFSGLPASEILNVGLVLSNEARENESDIADQNNGRSLQLRLRAQNNSELTATSNGLNELPITLEPYDSQRGFLKVDNEYRQNFTVNGNQFSDIKFGFRVSVTESIYADAEIYSLPMVVELVDVLTERILAERLVRLEVKVGIQLQSNIAGTDAIRGERVRVPVVDFGVLKRGDSRRVSLQVRANTPAKITVESENKGRLAHEDGDSVYVDYGVNVDGVASSLEFPLVLTREVAKTIEGSAYPMDIIIGEISGAFAGSYSDTITFEVRPQ